MMLAPSRDVQAGLVTNSLVMTPRPQRLASSPRAAWAAVHGVFTDIDDTLTQGGVIEPAALDALFALRARGVPVVAITGRPVGWSEPFARDWPVAAIVPESGAVALIRDGELMRTEYVQDDAIRSRNAQRLAPRWLATAPGASPTWPSITASSRTSTTPTSSALSR
jgi:hypothetical protein